jgi:hypothetical protein
MASSPCHDKQPVGHLVTHEVQFRGPGTQSCELPEDQRGQVDHVFTNASIYPQTFTTVGSTTPGALAVAGPASPPPVRVPGVKKGPIRAKPSTGTASQDLEHVSGTGIGLPHTATAAFDTTVTAPWGSCPPPATPPAVNITLTR